MPTLNAAPPFTRVAVDSIQSVMRRLRATARSVGRAIAAKLGLVWGPRSACVGACASVQVGIVETVGWVEKPSTPLRGRRWVSFLNSVHVPWVLSTFSVLVVGLSFSIPVHATIEYGYAWGGFYVNPNPDTRTACTNSGGEFIPGNGCVFETGPAACKAVIAYWHTLPSDSFYNQFEFVSHGVPYTDPYGNAVYKSWCVLRSTNPGYGSFTLIGSLWPGITANPVARCAPGSPRNTDWYGVAPEDAALYLKCTEEDPPKNKDCCGAQSSGNPINTATGNKWQTETDFSGTGSSLSFARHFNLIAPYAKANLGYGWTHTYARWIKASSALPKATMRRHDGREYVFNFNATNSTWFTDADVVERLVELKDAMGVRSGWRVTTANDEIESYDATGKLITIVDRAGRTQTLAYSTATTPATIASAPGLLIQVSDQYGRQLNFTYDAGNRIITMQIPDGNVYTYAYTPYTYYSYGNFDHLVSVTQPGGAVKQYLYEGIYNAAHTLTGILDENSSRYATWGYDIDDRAVSSEHGGGVDKYTINRTYDARANTTSAIVTDPLGTARTYNFQTILGVVKTTGVSQPCPSCGGSSSQATTYDINGNVSSRTDFNNKKSCSAYDLTRNLETSRIDGLLSTEDCAASLATPPARPDVRKTSTTWHTTYRLPLTITEPAAAAAVGGAAGIKTTAFTYDSAGNVLTKKVTAPKNDGTATTDVRTWTWTYNTLGQILTAKDPAGKTTTTVYYAATDTAVPPKFTQGDAQTVTNAVGHTVTFNEYDKNGRLLKMTDANGLVTTMSYHPRGWLTSRAVANGVTTETTNYTYDNVGQLTRVTMPDGSALNYAYDDAHRLVGLSDLSTGTAPTGNGSLRMQLANLSGNKIVYTLDTMGNRIGESNFDPTNTVQKTKTRIIDSLNRLQQDIGGTTYATAPTQAITQYGYDNNANLTTTTDPLGRVTTNTYDALNRLVSVIDPYNGSAKPTSYLYDNANNLTRVTDPENKATDYTYNGHNNLITQASPDTGTTKFTYNAMGNVVTKFDAANRCSLTSYDNLHRATAIRYFASTNATTNTAAGCAAATTATLTVEETHATTYDSITATLGGPGGKGRVSRVSDAAGRVDYVYDLNGRITSKAQVTTGTTNTTKTVTYSYNASGQMTAMTTPSGQTITYVYGAPTSGNPGKITGIQLNGTDLLKGSVYAPFGPNGGWTWGNSGATLGSSPPLNQHLRIFDKDYRPIAIASDPQGYNRNITWDQANRITGITVPSGITLPGVSNAASLNQAFAYDQLDRLTTFNAGVNGATNAATGLGLLPTETFTYDGVSNRKTRTTQAPGTTSTQSTSYAYGNATPANHWLTGLTGANAWTYGYDAGGNTVKEGTDVNNAATTQYTLSYDAKNRLNKTQIGSNVADFVTYKINAMGQRVQKIGAGTYAFNAATAASFTYNARFVYDESGNLLGEYAPDGKLISETIWFNDLPVATLRPKGSNSGLPLGITGTGAATANNVGNNTTANKVNVDVYYLHPDHLGTPRVMTRSVAQAGATTGPNAVNKQVWVWSSDPFGTTAQTSTGGSANSAPNKNPQLVTGTVAQIAAASFEQNLRMPGQYEDQETKKFYNRYRNYAPPIGRYDSSDPIGLEAGSNTFGYANQMPIRWSDPLGLAVQVCQYPIYGVPVIPHAGICINGQCRGWGPEGPGGGSWNDNPPPKDANFCYPLDPPRFCDQAKYEACIWSMVGYPGTQVPGNPYSIPQNNCQQQQSRVTTRCMILSCSSNGKDKK
jgi:RHS repeat-associated protein